MNSSCGCKWGGCLPSKVAKLLLVVGGLNWGLVGVSMLMSKPEAWNLVHMIFGSLPMVEAIVYVVVGVSAIVNIFGCRCKKCMASCASCDACKVGGEEQKA